MNEKDQELNLEDIMREFGAAPEVLTDGEDEASHDLPDYLYEMPEEDAPDAAPEDPVPETPEDTGLTGDTIRLDEIAAALQQQEQPEDPADDAAPEEVEESEETAESEPEQSEAAQTDASQEYVPRDPIPFRPHSRLRELKRKLIAGPEKRYYELSELGLGKLQVAIVLSLAVILLSAGAGVLYAMDMVPESRTRLMVFGQIFAMLLGALLGCYQMMDGLGDLFHGKYTLNTQLCVTFVACCVDSLFCLKEQRVPLCAAFTLQVTMALWSSYQKRNTELGQMDTMRKATRLDSVVQIEDYYAGRPGIFRGEGQVEDFMDRYNEPTAPEKAQGRYALVCVLASAGIAVVAGLMHSVSMAFQIFSTTLLVAVPASFFVSNSRPMAILERRLHALGTVLCGWEGVKKLTERTVYPLTDSDIFPAGSIKMNGVKFYGDRDPEVTISYATSLICANGGGLVPVFQQLLSSRNGPKYPVQNFQIYPEGIGGEVCGESVIMGSSQFLRDLGVEIPAGTMVNQAVYVAIDGEFSGLFAVTYARMKYSAAGMVTLCGNRAVTPLITADDFLLTPGFLKEKFGVNTRRLVYPTREEKTLLGGKVAAEDATVLALTTRDGLAPAAYAISGAKALRSACRLGLTIHLIGGILGMLIMLALAVLGSVELLTPLNILLYQLVWMIPGLLVTEWTRTF